MASLSLESEDRIGKDSNFSNYTVINKKKLIKRYLGIITKCLPVETLEQPYKTVISFINKDGPVRA